jgi:transposase
VPIKQLEQQDLQALHRVRERLIKARTALVNEIRGLLSEYGIVLPQGITKFRTLVVSKLQDEQTKLTALSTEVFWHLYDEFRALEKRLAYDDEKLAAIGQAHPACQRLQPMPGIGPVTATALIAAIGDVTQFKNGRQLAAWLGLVPREHSMGGTPRLLGIRKRGDVYLRTWLVHGARATLRWIETTDDERGQWLTALMARRGKNHAAVTLAHKNARMSGPFSHITKSIEQGRLYRRLGRDRDPVLSDTMLGVRLRGGSISLQPIEAPSSACQDSSSL